MRAVIVYSGQTGHPEDHIHIDSKSGQADLKHNKEGRMFKSSGYEKNWREGSWEELNRWKRRERVK